MVFILCIQDNGNNFCKLDNKFTYISWINISYSWDANTNRGDKVAKQFSFIK